ncbi:dnaJ homolog subfamily A member 1-like [Ischnura elegans]|uniref:dnaJ homolog subfamily A member 1-like n=1 Tax=Ischnura elegans TaxID=197161 RepID=UPI001ED867E0|nr:dnaJ homolog subfamily A member 1-like [Ischnura elegans]
MRMNLELVESLCGFQKVIKTLDDRELLITNLPGNVTKHADVKCIMNEGMPQYKNPFEKGRLIIQFFVKFLTTISPDAIPMLEHCLPPRPEIIIPDGAEECVLEELDPEQEARRQEYKNAYEEDDMGNGPSKVNCQTH